MTSPNETIRRMLLAQLGDDPSAFRTAVEEFITDEKRKSHHVVARDLERLLHGGGEVRRLHPIRAMFGWESDIPKDGDRGLPLLRAYEPESDLEDLVLTAHVRDEIERFIVEAGRAELLRAHGVRPPTRLLLCGPPGCGKTTAAEAVARALSLPLAVVRFDVVISSYLGETAANLRKIFDFIVSRPMVVLFDEFDAIAKHRDDDFEHGELKRVVNAFLQLLDGLRGDGVVIAATNHQGMLDSAVWRRFDEVVRLDLPDAASRRQVLARSLRGMPIAGAPDWQRLEQRSEGWSHSDLERLGQMAVRAAILSDRAAVTGASLEDALGRYEVRMAVVRGASARLHSVPGKGRPSDAILEGKQPTPTSGDAGGGTGESCAEATAQRGDAKGTRARASRTIRPRHRPPGGAVGERDEDEGTGGGR